MKIMKNKILIILTMGMFLASCLVPDEEKDPVVMLKGGPSLTAPGTITLTEENADQNITGFTWTAADFGYPAGVTYTLQVDAAGNNFENAFSLLTTNGMSASFKVSDLNNKMLTFGLPGDWTSSVEFRVISSVSEYVDPQVSNVIPSSITTYDVVVDYPKLYVPGSYQGWDPSNVNTVVYSVKNNGIYQGYVWFPDESTKFKFTPAPNWDSDWGDTGADGTLDVKGTDIEVTGSGYYRLIANINTLTYSVLKTHWGLIGDATPGGWDNDQDMTYDPENMVWTITVPLTAGKIKFRANDAWDLNYGDDGPDGKLEEGGADITIDAAGNYTVTLNLSVAVPTYTLVKN
jgi:hypothetical protein